MPQQISAGVLLHRRSERGLEVLLVHPGGPFWRAKDVGAWMIPKGGIEPGETAAEAAAREWLEEIGSPLPGPLVPLCRIRQAGGKWVESFAVEGDLDPATISSNHFEVEWPPRSGNLVSYPEVDRAAWFGLEEAREKMLPSQVPILGALVALRSDQRA